jgi:NAD+ kinase
LRLPAPRSDDERDEAAWGVAVTRVGMLGDGATAAADVVRDAGGEAVVGDEVLDSDADADVVAALGEDALLDALATAAGAPVLPVSAGSEYGGVTRDDLPDALAALATDDYEVDDRPTLAVGVGETRVRALADVMLVTDEPARISEYAVTTQGRDVDEVRADGVVVATPAGSHGYAADAGGPLLSADADALAVVPVAPFRVERVEWVLDAPASVTVVREEADVALFVDGRDYGFAAPHAPVEFDWGEPFPVAVVAASRGVGFE